MSNKKQLNKSTKKVRLETKTLASLLLLIGFSVSSLTIFSDFSSNADEVEILFGEEKVLVDTNGRTIKGSVPEIIQPESFDTVVRTQAKVPSSEVSKTYKKLRARKKPFGSIFSFQDQLEPESELSAYIGEALKRPQVLVSMKELSSGGNVRINLAKKRLVYYENIFKKIFAEEGVPYELISIGFVESTFDPGAVSPAGARGIWQFIPSTGRIFGLNQNDDFSDPIKSTRAAAKYLKRLHGRFDDWLLAIAAYNAGDTRVQQAINMSSGTKNFWEVSKFLPTETRNYVPRVIAAATVFK